MRAAIVMLTVIRVIVKLAVTREIVMPKSGRRAATCSRAAQLTLARRHNIPSLLAYHVPNLQNAISAVSLTTATLD